MKKKLISILQLALGVAIIAFMIFNMKAKGDLGKLAEAFRAGADNWPILAAGISSFGICLLLCNWRWLQILKAQGLNIGFRRSLTLYFIGHFFNSFMPGAVSGDFVKAYFVSKETHHLKTEAVSTVFIDRIMGLLALIMLTIVIMLARLDFFLAYTETKIALVFNVILFFSALVGFLVVFRKNLFEQWTFFKRLEQKTALGGMIKKVYDSFHLCMNHPALLMQTVGISLVNHVVFILHIYIMGIALEIDQSFMTFLTVFPIINAVASIPVTPGGLGTREAATVFMLGVVGVTQAKAIPLSLLIYATMLIWSMVGGIVYMLYSVKMGSVKLSAIEAGR